MSAVSKAKAFTTAADHGALYALDSLVPLVMAGAGTTPTLSAPLRTIDVAPICVALLGVPFVSRAG